MRRHIAHKYSYTYGMSCHFSLALFRLVPAGNCQFLLLCYFGCCCCWCWWCDERAEGDREGPCLAPRIDGECHMAVYCDKMSYFCCKLLCVPVAERCDDIFTKAFFFTSCFFVMFYVRLRENKINSTVKKCVLHRWQRVMYNKRSITLNQNGSQWNRARGESNGKLHKYRNN